MGRIKTEFIKKIGQKIYLQYRDRITTDFDKNKELVKEVLKIESKKVRNIVTGYITRLKRKELEGKLEIA
ncbi:MAG: 30S ribosomal protein S17e [Candidatus Aenigmarchaeota archaeon ex4484_224]|nr:MAG: 30S ribosomal protein S17e [Candidatus Aenigmarchaeota archaeon ex4484_224]